jgi:polyisoprenoid-binding protein YceI
VDLHHDSQTEVKEMWRRIGGKLAGTKILNFPGIGFLLVAISAAAAIGVAAVDRPVQPGHDRPAAKVLPAVGIYKIDPAHSFAYFGARHHVVGLVRGRFEKVNGTITVSPDLGLCSVDVTIDVASISTQITRRDDDLRSPEYFDVNKFPTMTYRGQGIRKVSSDSWIMDGSLTMHGVTRIVPLTFNFNGAFPPGDSKEPVRVAFHATAGAKRAEYGMGARDNLDELGILTTPDVAIEIDVEADATAPAL